ncbi:NACHT domain-containing NTPase [Paenibacillus xylanexedens]|uniref:NACHT domain-containing protein n=1 Tax=Paenibacillus xylanexedens TaxID=528191 RepID=UPI00119FE2CF|nr:hypothetical protein [Paenibacillus xylanexedens]
MPKYDLGKIGFSEFERMCQSLIQQFIGNGTLIFGAGKDGAREATFEGSANFPSPTEKWSGKWIFQVKYHDLSLISVKNARTLIIEEIDSELNKITQKYKYECDNFLLLTNVPLSPVFKTGTRDVIEEKILKYKEKIPNITILGADEICGLLDSNPSIRRTYREFITSGDVLDSLLEGIASKQQDTINIVKSYCYNLLHKDEKHAVLDDAGDSEDKRVELQEVFIDINVRPITETDDGLFDDFLWEEYALANNSNTGALSYLLDDEITDIVLVGGPGEGKSTLTQYVSQIHRARITNQLKSFLKTSEENYIKEIEKTRVRIPFRIVLKDFAQWFSENQDQNILVYLTERIKFITGRDISTTDVHKVITKNPILLILDGLDEVPDKKMKNNLIMSTITSIKEFRELCNADIKVIATTRPFGYTDDFDPEQFLHLNVLKLSEEQAKEYTKRWIAAKKYEEEESARIYEKFLICLEDQVIKVLITTPLQVTIILVIIRARGTLPKQREELFETYTDTIYQREQKKNINLLRTEKDLILGLHKYVAYILQKNAETDETASQMEESEFKEHVETYIRNQNPMLSVQDFENIVNQIIKEAEERLILITNNPKGRIGFPLTSMREFLTAAHLVDTSTDTVERDSRFKAIVLSTHWRNVVLFFAGRVGRTRPGEISSMIDVCRSEVDLQYPDNYLKRGASLVIDMIEDRVIRVPRNEMSALQYGMLLFEEGYIANEDYFISKLRSFSLNAKDQVIKPYLQKKINNFDSDRIKFLLNSYDALFSEDESLKNAIKKALLIDNIEILEKAIEYAIKYNFALKDVVSAWVKLNKLSGDCKYINTPNKMYLLRLLEEDSSGEILVSIAKTILDELVGRKRRGIYPNADNNSMMRYLELIGTSYYDSENKLYVFVLLKIISLYDSIEGFEENEIFNSGEDLFIHLPGCCNPVVLERVVEDIDVYNRFLHSFKNKTDNFTNCLKYIVSFIVNLSLKTSPLREELVEIDPQMKTILLKISGYKSDKIKDEQIFRIVDFIKNSSSGHLSYNLITEQLRKLINADSPDKYNSYKIFLWINTNFDQAIEEDIDPGVLKQIFLYLELNNLPKEIFSFLRIFISFRKNINQFALYKIDLMEKNLVSGKEYNLDVLTWMADYNYEIDNLSNEEFLEYKKSISSLLASTVAFLSEGDKVYDKSFFHYIHWLLINAFDLNLIDEEQLLKITSSAINNRIYDIKANYSRRAYKNVTSNLLPHINSVNEKNERFSVLFYVNSIQNFTRESRLDISEKLWVQYKNDQANKNILTAISYSNVSWGVLTEEFLKDILDATDTDKKIWIKIIGEGTYVNDNERDNLNNFLIKLLKGDYSNDIKSAALGKLFQISLENEAANLNENDLNLPLVK